MNELQRFKCILEYFVTHLEYLQTNDTKIKGYKDYILPKLPISPITGHGYKGDSIQKHIEQWAEYPFGYICINIQGNFGYNYMTKKCYLNWYAKQSDESTGYNILTRWSNNQIVALRLSDYKYWLTPPVWEDSTEMTVSELGLFDKKEPNDNIKIFFAEFSSYIKDFTQFRIMEPIIQILESNHNIVLHGAPGTGKTYAAKEIAKAMHCSKDQIGFVQFHPSYDYTDFVEGLRPVKSKKEGDTISFERKDGIFKTFCKEALKAYNEAENKKNAPKYVFVIDEINRGDMSKIFGELFFSIDPGYRGEKGRVATQYQNLIDIDHETNAVDVFKDGFYVPENVYIIGTMNDIDRSVESMDFAMRRRFAFVEIPAAESQSMLTLEAFREVNTEQADKAYANIEEIKSKMNALNAAIISDKIGLSHEYQIGAAYFLKSAIYANEENPFEVLWNNHVKSILTEYLRGTGDEQDKLNKLKAAYDGKTQDN